MNNIPDFDEKIYSVVKNLTANKKVVISALNGVEIPPNATVNLRAMFRKAQLIDASQEIYHFIGVGILKDMSEEKETVPAPASPEEGQKPEEKKNVQEEVKQKIQEAKDRDLLNEINGSSTLSRLEDLIIDQKNSDVVKRAAKVRYMQLRGWVDDDGKLIEGSADDEGKDITDIDTWEFQSFSPTT